MIYCNIIVDNGIKHIHVLYVVHSIKRIGFPMQAFTIGTKHSVATIPDEGCALTPSSNTMEAFRK